MLLVGMAATLVFWILSAVKKNEDFFALAILCSIPTWGILLWRTYDWTNAGFPSLLFFTGVAVVVSNLIVWAIVNPRRK